MAVPGCQLKQMRSEDAERDRRQSLSSASRVGDDNNAVLARSSRALDMAFQQLRRQAALLHQRRPASTSIQRFKHGGGLPNAKAESQAPKAA